MTCLALRITIFSTPFFINISISYKYKRKDRKGCAHLKHLPLSFESVRRVNQNHVGCEVRWNKHNHLIQHVLEHEVLSMLQATPVSQQTWVAGSVKCIIHKINSTCDRRSQWKIMFSWSGDLQAICWIEWLLLNKFINVCFDKQVPCKNVNQRKCTECYCRNPFYISSQCITGS